MSCREWGAPDVLRLEEAESPSLGRHKVRITLNRHSRPCQRAVPFARPADHRLGWI